MRLKVNSARGTYVSSSKGCAKESPPWAALRARGPLRLLTWTLHSLGRPGEQGKELFPFSGQADVFQEVNDVDTRRRHTVVDSPGTIGYEANRQSLLLRQSHPGPVPARRRIERHREHEKAESFAVIQWVGASPDLF